MKHNVEIDLPSLDKIIKAALDAPEGARIRYCVLEEGLQLVVVEWKDEDQ